MSATKAVKAVGSKVNPINTTHKRWVSFVALATFALPFLMNELGERSPDSVGIIGRVACALAEAAGNPCTPIS